MKKHLLAKTVALVLFCGLFVFGVRVAQGKWLWNDEIYSQIHSVEQLSYGDILRGRVTEGNNSPLFYILQKGICDLTNYELPFVWKGEWAVADPQSQVLLRLLPNFFMSLTITMIFYVFALEYSLLAGIYAFFIAMSTEIMFAYWAEARPYALWGCLSAFQAVYFFRLVRASGDEAGRGRHWRTLGIIHVLLSLTAVFGTVQAFIVSMVMFAFYRRKLSQYILLLFVPLLFGFFYFFHAQHYVFGLPPKPAILIYENIPVDRLILMYLSGIVALGYFLWKRQLQTIDVIWRYGTLGVLMLAASLGIMTCFAFTADPGWKPFMISSRYFIFLAPLGIVTAAVLSLEVFKLCSASRWMMINWLIVCLGFLAIRFFRSLHAMLSGLGIF